MDGRHAAGDEGFVIPVGLPLNTPGDGDRVERRDRCAPRHVPFSAVDANRPSRIARLDIAERPALQLRVDESLDNPNGTDLSAVMPDARCGNGMISRRNSVRAMPD